ncbi:hypothetical protein [Nocardia sp. NPDC050435]|uniref:hypothetical protein n=1 Tax=Nocardia sp. NPDC050435 TaxID=3155040 RepID=UPI003404E98B
MPYTIDELHAALNRLYDQDEDQDEDFDSGDPGNNVWHEFYWDLVKDAKDASFVVLPGIGAARILDEHGGEGQGDSYYFIFSVTDSDENVRIFHRDGWYQSHNGGYYEGPTTERVAQEKLVTVYEPLAA